MPNLTARDTTAEIMDDFSLPPVEIDPVLEGLGKVNSWFGGHSSLIKALKIFPVKDQYHISDWGCGGGDVLVAIAKWTKTQHLALKLTGIDAAPSAIEYATRAAAGFKNISFVQADVISDIEKLGECDVVICSLFSHHFDDELWVKLIRNMHASARKGIVLTDLHRHWVLYYAVIFITHVLTGNKMVRNDGPLSVKRAFKKHELVQLLKKAQINNYNLTWSWPFRWQLIIYKS